MITEIGYLIYYSSIIIIEGVPLLLGAMKVKKALEYTGVENYFRGIKDKDALIDHREIYVME